MTSSYNFEDNFWETDFTGVQGFEVLVKRLKDGKKMAQDFEDFLKARAKIEETYAKEMQRLAKNAHGESEIGTLRQSWDSLKCETESCSREHFAVSQRMTSELERTVKDFKDKQKDARKKIEDAVKKAQAAKKIAYLNENKAKQDYFSKCKIAEKADELVCKSGHQPAKKLEELKSKAKRAQLAAEAADAVYIEAVRNLEDARVNWEREMEAGLQQLQVIEQDRVVFLRGMMWKYCNVCSSMAVQEDEMYETVRMSLEKCDEEQDIRAFVETKRTGRDRPAPVEYENYHGKGDGRSAAPRTLPHPPQGGSAPTSSASPGPSRWHRAPATLPGDPGYDDHRP